MNSLLQKNLSDDGQKPPTYKHLKTEATSKNFVSIKEGLGCKVLQDSDLSRDLQKTLERIPSKKKLYVVKKLPASPGKDSKRLSAGREIRCMDFEQQFHKIPNGLVELHDRKESKQCVEGLKTTPKARNVSKTLATEPHLSINPNSVQGQPSYLILHENGHLNFVKKKLSDLNRENPISFDNTKKPRKASSSNTKADMKTPCKPELEVPKVSLDTTHWSIPSKSDSVHVSCVPVFHEKVTSGLVETSQFDLSQFSILDHQPQVTVLLSPDIYTMDSIREVEVVPHETFYSTRPFVSILAVSMVLSGCWLFYKFLKNK